MKSMEVEERSSIDVSRINADYEKQMYERMSNLAVLDLETATVAAIDYEAKDDEEINGVLEDVFTGEWISRFNEITCGVYGDVLINAFLEIADCKKYIVYGEDYQDGVALMMWYFDIYMEECSARVRLLVDSETEDVYYIKVNFFEDQSVYKEYTNVSANYVELYDLFEENVLACIWYYSDYYESNWQQNSSAKEEWYSNVKMDVTQLDGSYALPYGKNSLDFQFISTAGEAWKPDTEMGIALIGELIPEMMQN